MTASVDIRRAADRGTSTTEWLDSRHSFSFGDYYDPSNTHHGLLLVNNDDRVKPGAGFDTHPHRDMEIVTWVLDGCLQHRDSLDNAGVIYPGLAQRMSAGTGLRHSEKNGSASESVHFVQMWVVPDQSGVAPGYQQAEIDAQTLAGELIPVASGMRDDAAVTIHNKNATLYAARLSQGDTVTVPHAPFLHLFVPRGEVTVEGVGQLREGDAARFTDSGGGRIAAITAGEVLVWEMHANLYGA